MPSESLRESRLRAAYSGRQILPLAATSSRGGVISDLHNPLAPRDGYTKLAIRWEATLRDLLFRVGSGSARAVDFSIFSVVLCTPQEFFKR